MTLRQRTGFKDAILCAGCGGVNSETQLPKPGRHNKIAQVQDPYDSAGNANWQGLEDSYEMNRKQP
jgi:hypothetical protein